MPGARRSVGAAKRHGGVVGPVNNATTLMMWDGSEYPIYFEELFPGSQPASWNPLSIWDANRKVRGWITAGGALYSISGTPYGFYDGTGAPSSPLYSDPYHNWMDAEATAVASTGHYTSYLAQHAPYLHKTRGVLALANKLTTSGNGTPLWPWHNDTAYGTTGGAAAVAAGEGSAAWNTAVASALNPAATFSFNGTIRTLCADFKMFCQTCALFGHTGIAWDGEMYGYSNADSNAWSVDYPSMPGGQSVATTRLYVKLRGQQLATIQAAQMPNSQIYFYHQRINGGWQELYQYVLSPGTQSPTQNANRVYDSLIAGFASVAGIDKVILGESEFYKNPVISSWDNAYLYDHNGILARLSTLFTDTERLAAMRRLGLVGMLWPTSGSSGSELGNAMTVSDFTTSLTAAVKWGMHGQVIVWALTMSDAVQGGGGQTQDHGVYEPSFQAALVPGTADSVAPVCTITSPTSSATYQASTPTLVLSGAATDNMAIHRVEWANAANSTSGSCQLTFVNTTAGWNPLDSAQAPQNASIPITFRHDWTTQPITIAAGPNVITVTAYDTHGNSHTATLTVTPAATFSYPFTAANGTTPVGWTPYSGTVDIQSNKARTQTAAVAYASAGMYHNAACPQDYEWTGNATLTQVTPAEFYGAINVRATANTFNDITQNGGWRILFVAGSAQLYRVDATGGLTWLDSGPANGFTQGSVLRVRINLVGTACKVRYWKDPETEPTPWGIDYNDPSAPTGTGMSVGCRNGSDATADRWDWDDITVNSGTAPMPPPSPPPAPTALLNLFYSKYPTAANEIWVDGALGNDSFAGTAVAPKATIQAAINSSSAGSRIMVRPYAPGYATHSFTGHSGTATNYIQMVAPSGAVINANGGAGTGSAATSMIGAANFIAVYGFEYVGLNSSGSPYETGVVVGNGAHDVAVWGCYFHGLASHGFSAPGDAGQGWAGSDRIDFCYNRVTGCSRWNPFQASGFSMIQEANIGSAWPDGYKNHVIGNVIDNCWTDPSAVGGAANLTDGNCVIFDIGPGYTGKTLCAHNLTVGAGGRGLHALQFNNVDIWLNTSVDNIQNLPGSWDAELSLWDSTGSNCQYNVAAARVGRNRVGLFQGTLTGSSWNNNVFLRGTGGSEANDPGVASNNNVNKTATGPANYFTTYQQGVYQSTSITDVAGFRPKAAQVSTFAPPTNVRNAVSPWPDALGFTRPSSGVWAYGAFEATAVPVAASSGVHWGADITQDIINLPNSANATAKAAYASVKRAAYNSHIVGFSTFPPMTAPGVYDWGGDAQGAPAYGLDDSIDLIRGMVEPSTGIKMITLCSAPGFMKPDGNTFNMTEAVSDSQEQAFANLYGDILNRYPDFDWFQFWNEMKGMDSLLPADQLKYTRMFNLAWVKKQSVRSTAKLGGPYVVWDSYETGVGGNPASALGAAPCTFNGGAIHNRVLDMHLYWRDHATGWDFICLDAFIGNRYTSLGSPYRLTPGKTHAQMADKFVQIVNWVRTYIEPQKPIVFSEFYPVDGNIGLSVAQQEDQVITCLTLIRDNCDVRDGVYTLQWLQQSEPPNPVNYSTGAETGLMGKLRTWEAQYG